MKSRVLTAAILILIAIPIIWFSDSIVLNIFVSLVSMVSVFELMNATKNTGKRTLTIVSILYSGSIPFLFCIPGDQRYGYITVIVFVYAILLFMLLLFKNEKYRLENIAVAFMMSNIIPVFLSSLIVLRRMPVTKIADERMGLIMMLLPILCVIVTDTFALFTGMLFGKHKLAKKVSPKKTIEGAIGGTLFGVAVFVVTMIICQNAYNIKINIPLFVLFGLITSVMGQFGDLFMSIIKRHCEIKDYGNLMPGHGGMLDRFDSMIFAAPTFMVLVYALDYLGVKLISVC